jgi:sugar fermentation stimulation protein A
VTSLDDLRFGTLVPATFVSRPNRFLLWADVGSRRVSVASRDPGRLNGILAPGARLLLAPSATPGRRTAFTLTLARQGDVWVCLVPALASQIVHFAVARGGVEGLKGAEVIRREVRSGASRIDLLMRHRGRPLLVEVKAAVHVEGRRALFPDCPTARGARHVRELIAARRRGHPAALVFVVHREDVDRLAPWAEVDPEFTRALREARHRGVRLLAYSCRVRPEGSTLLRRIPVEVD